jgi:hypothetical protein
MDVTRTSEGLVHIDKEDGDYLGIVTQLRSNSFAVTRLTSQRQSVGYIVRNESIEEWRAYGLTEHAGQVYIYGPYLEARTLSEILKLQSSNVLPYLSRLARALEQMEHHELPTPMMHTRAIAFLEDGGVLFLPKQVMQTITGHLTLEDQTEFYGLYNHPDLDEERNRSFALAVLLFYALTGEYPYQAESDEELRSLMRDQVVTKPVYVVPEIRPELSDWLAEILESPRTAAPSLEEWVGHFHQWIQSGTHRELSEEERIDIQAKATTNREAMEKSFRRREFFRKNWKRIALFGVIGIVLGTIPGTILYNSLQPREIAGLPPEEVVRTFYQSVNRFDHTTMQDAVVDGAGRQLIREVTNLYVMSRMRMSVELSTGFVDAQEWVDNGKPTLDSDSAVYGVANLQVSELPASGDEGRAFRAEYQKWQPRVDRSGEQAEPETGSDAVIGYERVDRLHLREEGDSWVIYRLERVESSEIDNGAAAGEDQAAGGNGAEAERAAGTESGAR